jgi:hypothetical protein
MERDAGILERCVDDSKARCDRMFGQNLLRFLGIDRTTRKKRIPVAAE